MSASAWNSETWPSPSTRWACAPGTFAASHWACAKGTIRSSVPCHTATGHRDVADREAPRAGACVRSSSCHPTIPWAPARAERGGEALGELAGHRGPVDRGQQAAQRVGDVVGRRGEERLAVVLEQGRQGLGAPAIAAGTQRRSPAPSRGEVDALGVGGAMPTPETAARHRPGSSAAQASARGPPPDQPRVTNSSWPRASRIAAASAASSATVAVVAPSARRVEPPYPGREQATEPQPALGGGRSRSREGYGGLGRAVVEDEGEAVVGAGDQDLEVPAVGGADELACRGGDDLMQPR